MGLFRRLGAVRVERLRSRLSHAREGSSAHTFTFLGVISRTARRGSGLVVGRAKEVRRRREEEDLPEGCSTLSLFRGNFVHSSVGATRDNTRRVLRGCTRFLRGWAEHRRIALASFPTVPRLQEPTRREAARFDILFVPGKKKCPVWNLVRQHLHTPTEGVDEEPCACQTTRHGAPRIILKGLGRRR